MTKPLLAASALVEDPSPLVLDVRERSDYLLGHWPGATHLDIHHWEHLGRSADGELHNTPRWHHEIGLQGIDGRRRVVVLDDGRMTEAARAWFILQWHGVPAQVLDGGWPALVALGVAVERVENVPPAVSYLRPAGVAPLVDLVTRAELLARLERVQIFDARTTAEHDGRDLRRNTRGGHLPGAISLPHAGLLTADGHLHTAPQLLDKLASAGLHRDAPVVTHCDAGGRAALAALAAVQAGYRDVSAYYLSFSDWAADDSCPIVQP